MPGDTDLTRLLTGLDPELHDARHVFVPWERREDAMAVLRRLAAG